MTKPQHVRTGQLGEDIACRYLVSKGFTVICQNYRKKWGEIDIVTQKNGRTHFVEVKTVRDFISSVAPEENLHKSKIDKLFRVFESYAIQKGTSLHNPSYDWQFDAVIVFLDTDSKKARIKYIDNIVVN